jgi:hypothetical protein
LLDPSISKVTLAILKVLDKDVVHPLMLFPCQTGST